MYVIGFTTPPPASAAGSFFPTNNKIRIHMTHASLFSGIGGFDLAAQWMGWDNLFHCELNPFCQTVLKYHWPNATTYTDINKTDFTIWRGRIDILTGGFPCQPFSTAGQRKGTADDRYLWPQMLRCIREVQPRWVVGENVDGIFTWNDGLVFETVCADLENEGYEVQALRIPACATGAPHRRDRWWFVAHAEGEGMHREKGNFREEDGRPLSELLPKPNQSIGGFTTHPDLRHRPGRSPGSHWSADHSQLQERGAQAERTDRCHQLSCDAAPHACSQGTGRESGTPTDQERPTSTDRPTCLRQTQWPTSASGAQPTIADAPHPQSTERQQCRPTRAGRHGLADDSIHAPHHGHQGLQRDELGRTSQQRQGPPRPIAQRFENEHWLEAATRLCILDDGLPGRLDAAALFTKPQHAAGKWRKESLKAAGNAVVPQIPYAIFQAIAHAEAQEIRPH